MFLNNEIIQNNESIICEDFNEIQKSKRKVILGISGGVDSSVALKILKDYSFKIIAVFLKMFESSEAEKALFDAKNLAKDFNVEFITCDVSKIFEEKILSYFYKSYTSGLTPSPCLICNKEIKFFLLYEIMKEKNFNYIATGHYAKIKKIKINLNLENSKNKELNSYSFLSPAKDEFRDQSYFISSIPNEMLQKTLFPIGSLNKDFVRSFAKTFNLKISEKKDSQDLCFLSNNKKFGNNYMDFLLNYSKIKNLELSSSSGIILNKIGEKIGEHNGLHNFTIGQRRRLKISSKNPLYVISIDEKKKEIVADLKKFLIKEKIFISPTMVHPAIFNKNFCIKNLEEYDEHFEDNFFYISFSAYAECRSRMKKSFVTVLIKKNEFNEKIQITFNKDESGIANGQFCVVRLFSGEIIISGEIIFSF